MSAPRQARGSDSRFFQSLDEFITQEKRFLRCPEEGPDQLRYTIYRTAFNKVAGEDQYHTNTRDKQASCGQLNMSGASFLSLAGHWTSDHLQEASDDHQVRV